MAPKADTGRPSAPGRWLNRNVLAFSLTSFLSDFCHEAATAVLPQFMHALGSTSAALGLVEGSADAASSFVKLGAGYRSDKAGHRKAWCVFGYAFTGFSQALFALAMGWPLILFGRVAGWLGRGIRGPLRDAMLAESVAPEDRGKAFGMHRAADTLGAVAGPLAALVLLELLPDHPAILQSLGRWSPGLFASPVAGFRLIFLLSLVPGILSIGTMAFLVTEKRRAPNHAMQFRATLRALPGKYRAFLVAVGVFGAADFAPTLMVLRATTSLQSQMGVMGAARAAVILYLIRNIAYAAASYPLGALADRFHRVRFLAVGYGLGALTFAGFVLPISSVGWFAALFILSGVFIAWEDTLEGVAVRDYVGAEVAGTAYGLLGAVNGVGDFASSALVGLLWSLAGPAVGFGYAGAVALVGTFLMARLGKKA